MKRFQILDDGTPVAIVFAADATSPSASMVPAEGADLDIYSLLSYYDEPGNSPTGSTRLSAAQYARMLGGNGIGTYREVDENDVPVSGQND